MMTFNTEKYPFRIAINGEQTIFSDNLFYVGNKWFELLSNDDAGAIEYLVMLERIPGTDKFQTLKIYTKE
jgi:hypothetical protein